MKILIVGAGSVGRHLVERLESEQHDIVVVDHNEDVLEQLSSLYDINTYHGSASSHETLKCAGATDAEMFIAVTNSDETNLISCLLVDSINENLHKIARVREIVTEGTALSDRITSVFDQLINPDFEAVSQLIKLVEVPGAVEVMEFANGGVWVVGVLVGESAPVVGRRLRDLPVSFEGQEVLVAAIARDGQFIIPKGDDTIEAHDEVYVVAQPHKVSLVFKFLGIERKPVQSVMVYGCQGIGERLSRELAAKDIKVKLVVPDGSVSEVLAGRLSDVLVLSGDATDQDLLIDEGIFEVDLFVGATEDEEKNILSTLLAKRLGAKAGAVIVRKSSYINLIPAIGIDIVVNPHIAAASKILRHVRRGAVSSVFSTRNDTAEVFELEVPAGSKIVDKPLKDLKFPPGTLVAAIYSGHQVTIPRGDKIIHPGERVIFFVHRKSAAKLEKMLEVKRWG